MRAAGSAILLFLLAFSFVFSFGQAGRNGVAELYSYVDHADSLAFKDQRIFYLEKFLKDDYNYRETWRYSERAGRIFYFQIDYIVDSLEYMEAYYLDQGGLVCAEEYEKINYSFFEDELKFGSIFYFYRNVPRHVAILGRKTRPGSTFTSPEQEAQTRFRKRYAELRQHIPMLIP